MLDPVAGADRLLAIRHLVAVGGDPRSVRRAREDGELVRLRRGAYTHPDAWGGAQAGERYDLRIAAVLATRKSDVVLSHHSAARVWGLPLIDPWPDAVHITEPLESKRRSKNGVVVHRYPLQPRQVDRLGGIAVTNLPRTLIDLARAARFRDAVAALDYARRQSAPGCSPADLLGDLDGNDVRARRRVLRAIEFSTDQSMSPLESFSRVVLHELGFTPPQLQREFLTRGGRRLVDFWWEDERVAGECDGRVKYSEDRFRAGRRPEEVVWDEKLRENELAEVGVRLVRWTWHDCLEPDRIAARLRNAGLRQSAAAPRVPLR